MPWEAIINQGEKYFRTLHVLRMAIGAALAFEVFVLWGSHTGAGLAPTIEDWISAYFAGPSALQLAVSLVIALLALYTLVSCEFNCGLRHNANQAASSAGPSEREGRARTT